jgi:hypothetical protein
MEIEHNTRAVRDVRARPLLGADTETPAFQEHNVTPAPIHAAKSRTCAYDPEPRPGVQFDARGVFREDASLKSPNTFRLRGGNQSRHEPGSDAATSHRFRHVNADLTNATIYRPPRYGAQSRPADNLPLRSSDQPASLQMACVPFFPVGNRLLKCRVSGFDSLQVDGAHCFPVIRYERFDRNGALHTSIVEKKAGKPKPSRQTALVRTDALYKAAQIDFTSV